MTALRRILSMARSGRSGLAAAALFGTGAAGCAVALMGVSAWLVSRAAQQPPVLFLMVAIVSVRAFGIGRGVLRYVERLTGHDAAFRVLADLRVTVYEKLERLAPAGLRLRSGDLLSRLVADVDALQDLWLRILLPYAVAAAVGAGSVLAVALMLPSAGVVLLLTLVIVAVLAPLVASAVARRAEARIAPLAGEVSAATVDVLHGASELVAYGAAQRRLDALARVDAQLVAAHRRSAAGAGLGALVSALAAGAAVWFSLRLGVPAVRSGALDGLLLAVVVLIPIAVHEVFVGLSGAAQQVPRVRAAAERVLDVLDSPDPVVEPPVSRTLPAGPYGLALHGVRAGWPGGPDVLVDLDLDVPAGHRVAVVGPSGVGKSTLAAALLRFLDVRAGRVELVGSDGAVPTNAVQSDELRTVVGLFEQEAHLFDSTVGENIRLARRSATDAEIADVLERARLTEWVATLPRGLDTPVGEHGAAVSGGQRQRIALARVLLADFPVVVLDEPTEHLDDTTAAALMADLLAATRGRTVVLVTHRTDGLDAMDSVVRLTLASDAPQPLPAPAG